MRRVIRVAAYVFYTLVVLIVFLYVTFPYGRFEQFFLARLQEETGLDVKVRQGRLLFPLGIAWAGVAVNPPDAPPYALDLLRAKVEPFAAFRGVLEVRIETRAYGGLGTGGVTVNRGRGAPHYHVWATVRELDLARLPATKGSLEGQASLTLDGEWDGGALLAGSGQSHLDLVKVQMKHIEFKGLPIPPVTLASLRLRTQWRRGVVDLTEFSAQGPEMTMKGNGSLLVRDPMWDSLMNLLVQVTLTEGGKAAQAIRSLGGVFAASPPLELSVKGTAGRPTVLLNNIPLSL